jgi:hypothetical protein
MLAMRRCRKSRGQRVDPTAVRSFEVSDLDRLGVALSKAIAVGEATGSTICRECPYYNQALAEEVFCTEVRPELPDIVERL